MSTRARRHGVLAVLLVALLATGGCSRFGGTSGEGYVGSSSAAGVDELAPAERGEPIESSGPGIDGGTVDVADHRGQVVVVNVWWSQCVPCIRELPLLQSATAGFGDDVALVGINIRDSSPENAVAFERGLGVDLPSIYSPSGSNLLDFDGRLRPNVLPSTAVLDRQGRLAALITGEIPTEQTLVSVLEPLVAEPAGSGTGAAPEAGAGGG